jgi:hypothetical protein
MTQASDDELEIHDLVADINALQKDADRPTTITEDKDS